MYYPVTKLYQADGPCSFRGESMRRSNLFLFFVVLLTLSFAGVAQSRPDDEGQIRAIVQSEEDAWNRGDAEAFGAHYAEDGSFTNVIGQQLYGRKAFVAQHAGRHLQHDL